jgi:hypothetical protein
MRPLLCNKLPVPAKDGVRGDERSDFVEGAVADGFTPNRESASLVVGQSKSFATELLLENAILFSEIVDHVILLARYPSGHGGNEDLPRLENGRHPSIVANPAADRQLST